MPASGPGIGQLRMQPLPRRRRLVDQGVHAVVRVGGAAVVGAITLIFVYLLWVVAPLFLAASVEPDPPRQLTVSAPVRLLQVNESNEIVLTVQADGQLVFSALTGGPPLDTFDLGTPIEQALPVNGSNTLLALRSGDELYFVELEYVVSFDGEQRSIRPVPRIAFEGEPVDIGEVRALDVWYADNRLLIASVDAANRMRLMRYSDVEVDFALEFARTSETALGRPPAQLYFGPRGQWLFAIGSDTVLDGYDLGFGGAPTRVMTTQLDLTGTLHLIQPLLGRYSLLVTDGHGRIHQHSLLRDEEGYRFQRLRSFDAGAPVKRLLAEPRRKGFATLDANGQLVGFHTTAERRVFDYRLARSDWQQVALSPRADLLLLLDTGGTLQPLQLHNEHPEVSWSAIWSKVWYEGYPEPLYSWQSSSADNEFEPKFSLTPLLFGTLKAAFYAMLFAAPLAVMGAVYTGYFMHSSMRAVVKPGLEVMAALPTVVLGFLAGLWLAPLIEAQLASVLLLIGGLPLGMLVFSVLYTRLPAALTGALDGWYAAVSIPVLLLTVVLCFQLGPWLEAAWFDGHLPQWLRIHAGLEYDQRNALVVGIAMGLAVIPTIFSIAEDAVHGVPAHLRHGSLALGATEWQTLVRVVLLTASPGIFSALMIGMGRAAGETMIVLMATGNTPVMDWNLFQGMRTFAANIAVELPEAEVASSHYRILFMAALVLFLMTFAVNTLAEVVRQRLRARYGSL